MVTGEEKKNSKSRVPCSRAEILPRCMKEKSPCLLQSLSLQLGAPPSCLLPREAQQKAKAATWSDAPQGSPLLPSLWGTDLPVPDKQHRVLPWTSQHLTAFNLPLPKAMPPTGEGPKSLGCLSQSPRAGFSGCGGRSGLWQLPGEFQFPIASCTLCFCFPLHKGKQSTLGRSPGLVRDHLHGTVPLPADLLAHTYFLFSPPHPSLLARSRQGWHAAQQHTGTPETQLSELGGQQGALALRAVLPTVTGCAGTPESPSPRTGFISRRPLHSQKRSESTTEAELRGNFQSPLPTSCLPGPCTEGPSSHRRAAPSGQTWPPWSAERSRQQLPLCTARQA